MKNMHHSWGTIHRLANDRWGGGALLLPYMPAGVTGSNYLHQSFKLLGYPFLNDKTSHSPITSNQQCGIICFKHKLGCPAGLKKNNSNMIQSCASETVIQICIVQSCEQWRCGRNCTFAHNGIQSGRPNFPCTLK